MKEENKVYYAMGIQLGKAISKKEGALKYKHNKFLLDHPKVGYSYHPIERLEKTMELFLMAEIPAVPLLALYDASADEINNALNFILFASTRPLYDENFIFRKKPKARVKTEIEN